ncbi:MAG: hypothetical protein FWF92_00535 [Oscillospiraceae bacterium]|nr:hypothetical protein [Oscillospiraceae bacterium]
MSEENKRLYDRVKEKVKEHKTEIIIAGITVATIVGVVLLTENWDVIKKQVLISDVKNSIIKNKSIPSLTPTPININITNNVPVEKPVDVSKHLRNLPMGWNASLEKIKSALEHGFTLTENQTWVDNYTKMCA